VGGGSLEISSMRARLGRRGCEAAALAAVVARYWLQVAPVARRELRAWGARAAAIPDPILRGHALDKLRNERLNAEAAAAFATLAPRAHQASVARLTLAFQVMVDYLDTLSEQAVDDPLENGRQLHRALSAAVDLDAEPTDFYRHHSESEDGGYLDALVTTCRTTLHMLPAGHAVVPPALRAAHRASEAQSRSHSAERAGLTQLRVWSAAQAPDGEYEWWELAAGATAPLSLHALFAAAADPRTGHAEADAVESAYYPPICALATLLDSLVDYSRDGIDSEHSFVAYYPSNFSAAERLGAVTRHALAAARDLPRGSRHAVIVTGVAGYYLSATEAASDFARPVTRAVIDKVGAIFLPILAIIRLRRLVRGALRANRAGVQ
jgi:tetraprenyl-beta-curcumene synthase